MESRERLRETDDGWHMVVVVVVLIESWSEVWEKVADCGSTWSCCIQYVQVCGLHFGRASDFARLFVLSACVFGRRNNSSATSV